MLAGGRAESKVPDPDNSTNGFHRDIIVIGASAGGVEALTNLTIRFAAMDAAIFVVLHTGPIDRAIYTPCCTGKPRKCRWWRRRTTF
jgi:chemotaxis response regulator CheB